MITADLACSWSCCVSFGVTVAGFGSSFRLDLTIGGLYCSSVCLEVEVTTGGLYCSSVCLGSTISGSGCSSAVGLVVATAGLDCFLLLTIAGLDFGLDCDCLDFLTGGCRFAL